MVVISGLIVLWRLTPRRDLAKEAQGIGLVAAFLVLAGKRQSPLGEGVRLPQAAGQQLGFTEGETTERLIGWRFPVRSSVPLPA